MLVRYESGYTEVLMGSHIEIVDAIEEPLRPAVAKMVVRIYQSKDFPTIRRADKIREISVWEEDHAQLGN